MKNSAVDHKKFEHTKVAPGVRVMPMKDGTAGETPGNTPAPASAAPEIKSAKPK